MSTLHFYKYQGAGNDFIIIDNRENIFSPHEETIAHLCNRRLGIGGDGLMLIEKDEQYDFKMVYFNSDGRESTMCGNGGRCIVLAAHHLGIIKESTTFNAIDGLHTATILAGDSVRLGMIDVDIIDEHEGYKVLNTGSPHIIIPVEDIVHIDVFEEGQKIRYSERFAAEGINVNFVQTKPDKLYIRTYERGVEDETWACGTGVTAAAIASKDLSDMGTHHVAVEAIGGQLSVDFTITFNKRVTNVFLTGPAVQVFSGEINIDQ